MDINQSIHPFIHFLYCLRSGTWSLSQGTWGNDRLPTHQRVQSHTHSNTTGLLERPISLQIMSLDMTLKSQKLLHACMEEAEIDGFPYTAIL